MTEIRKGSESDGTTVPVCRDTGMLSFLTNEALMKAAMLAVACKLLLH